VDPEQSTEPLDLIVARRPTSELMQRVYAAMQELPQGAERQAMSLLHSQLGEAGQTMSLIASIRQLGDIHDLTDARGEIRALRIERDLARKHLDKLSRQLDDVRIAVTG
jgi:hypothetical protein